MTLSDASALLHELHAGGVHIEAVGDRLRFRPPEDVTPEQRQRLGDCKPAILALLHEKAFAADAGAGAYPSTGSCRSCGQPDFVRPQAGGAWRCARCRPWDLPSTEIEWWPRVRCVAPLDAMPSDHHMSADIGPCSCFGSTSRWRLKLTGPWRCSRCHRPLPSPERIETVIVP